MPYETDTQKGRQFETLLDNSPLSGAMVSSARYTPDFNGITGELYQTPVEQLNTAFTPNI